MQILTYISVLHAYLVNDLLFTVSTARLALSALRHFFPQNSTTPLHPESTEHNLERGVGPGSLGNVISEHGVWSFILYPLALENRLISVRLML
jgi:hypothetical protein